MEWLDSAPCKGLSTDFFFPPLDAAVPNHYYAVGKYVCHSCPVWKECLTYSESNSEMWGMWGGLSPLDRKKPQSLAHGSIESYRSGCSCFTCRDAPRWDECQADLSKVPRMGDSYDLLSVVFEITR